MSASAPAPRARSSFFSLSPGTNSSDRIERLALALAADHHLPAAFRHELVALIVGAMLHLDDADARARPALALADDLGRHMDGVAVEHRAGELHLGHPEICHRRTERGVVHR